MAASGKQPGAAACHLTYRGEVTRRTPSSLTAAFCAGLLERALEEDVNIVNAEVLLRERGIKLTEESRSDMGAFSSSMTAEVTGGGQASSSPPARCSATTCRG